MTPHVNLENSPKKKYALIGWKLCFYNLMETELAWTVDVMMAQAKRIYILIMKVNKLFSFFLSWCFLKEIETIYPMFLSSYRNTCESLGELEKNLETLKYRVKCLKKLMLKS